jgi:hypothetical protein
MPDTITYVRPDLTGRKPALRGFIVRRIFAAGAKTARHTVIEAARAELAWSEADWARMTGHSRLHDYREGPHPAETYRLPHEWAAARVLNAWSHLHPVEHRIHANVAVLRSQIKTAAMIPSWGKRAESTRETLRRLVADRRRLAAAFFAETANYRHLRAGLEAPTDGAPAARAA